MSIDADQERAYHKDEPEHECDEDGIPDCDICSACKEHASFCSDCGESGCCGSQPYEMR